MVSPCPTDWPASRQGDVPRKMRSGRRHHGMPAGFQRRGPSPRLLPSFRGVAHRRDCTCSSHIESARHSSFRRSPIGMPWTGMSVDLQDGPWSRLVRPAAMHRASGSPPPREDAAHRSRLGGRKSAAVDSGILRTVIFRLGRTVVVREIRPTGCRRIPPTPDASAFLRAERAAEKATGTAPVVAPGPLLWGQGKVEAVTCRPDPGGGRRSNETRGKLGLSRRRPQALRLPAAAADSAADSAGPPAPPAPPEDPQGPPAPAPAD